MLSTFTFENHLKASLASAAEPDNTTQGLPKRIIKRTLGYTQHDTSHVTPASRFPYSSRASTGVPTDMAPTYELWQSVIAKIASEEWIDMRGKEHGNDMDSLTIGGQNGGRKITVLVSPDLIESSFEELQLQNRKQLDNNLARSPVEPILVLLDIIHGGHMFIPEEKSEEELFASKRGSVQELGQLVGWAQKYELEHLLVPYLKEWMPNEAEIDAIDIDVVVIAANLAFGLGDGGMYDKLINRLGFECSVNRNGDISYPNSIKKTKFARTMMPFGIDGEATKCPPFPDYASFIRRKVLTEMLKELQRIMRLYIDARGCINREIPDDSEDAEACTSSIITYMSKAHKIKIVKTLGIFDGEGFFRVVKLHEEIIGRFYSGSIKDLRERMLDMSCPGSHKSCDPFVEMRDNLRKESSMPHEPAASYHAERLKERAEKFKWNPQ